MPKIRISECPCITNSLAVEMMRRHEELFGRPAEQAAFDGGFASKGNLAYLKTMKINDVMFSERVGLAISDMVKDTWIYKRLRDFRAGIEGIISFLKRAIGLSRCGFRGLRAFNSYVFASIVSANLLVLARHKLT
jgi:IS5 family transposase